MVVSLFFKIVSPSCDFSLVARSAAEPLEIQAAVAPGEAYCGTALPTAQWRAALVSH